jgi:hypothetical protein
MLSRKRQKPSTTARVLNGVCGSIKRGILQACQKRAFLAFLPPEHNQSPEQVLIRPAAIAAKLASMAIKCLIRAPD